MTSHLRFSFRKKILCGVPAICTVNFMRSEIRRICHITRSYSFKKLERRHFDFILGGGGGGARQPFSGAVGCVCTAVVTFAVQQNYLHLPAPCISVLQTVLMTLNAVRMCLRDEVWVVFDCDDLLCFQVRNWAHILVR